MAMLVVVLVVVMVSPHSMGPPGCRKVGEHREAAKGVEKHPPWMGVK